MKNKYRILLSAAVLASVSLAAKAQVEERPRPTEWSNLVRGGRHMDRFETMPEGRIVRAQWGAEAVRHRLVDNGIERDDMSFWGGNILRGNDGLYHLYVCGWPENSRKGHMFWGNSTVFHATSDHLSGPYRIANSIGKGHNPEAYVLDDGRILVYMPYVDYCPAVISPSAPYERDGKQYVRIANFGLSPSRPQPIEVKTPDGSSVTLNVPSLQPYEEQEFAL